MTADLPTTPELQGAAPDERAARIEEHEQMVEVHIVWRDHAPDEQAERPVCRYCWHEGPDGQLRRVGWPCDAVQAWTERDEALASLRAIEQREAGRDADQCSPCLSKAYSGIGSFPWTCKNGHTLYVSGGPLSARNRMSPDARTDLLAAHDTQEEQG